MMGLKDIEWIKRLKGDHRIVLGKKRWIEILMCIEETEWLDGRGTICH